MENNKLKKFIKTTIRGFLNENINIDQYYESDVVYIVVKNNQHISSYGNYC